MSAPAVIRHIDGSSTATCLVCKASSGPVSAPAAHDWIGAHRAMCHADRPTDELSPRSEDDDFYARLSMTRAGEEVRAEQEAREAGDL